MKVSFDHGIICIIVERIYEHELEKNRTNDTAEI